MNLFTSNSIHAKIKGFFSKLCCWVAKSWCFIFVSAYFFVNQIHVDLIKYDFVLLLYQYMNTFFTERIWFSREFYEYTLEVYVTNALEILNMQMFANQALCHDKSHQRESHLDIYENAANVHLRLNWIDCWHSYDLNYLMDLWRGLFWEDKNWILEF
jgi:hypothetical protein